MTLFVSQSCDPLVDALNHRLAGEFAKQVVLVPNPYVKKWLLLELAKRRGIVMGLSVFTPSEWLLKQGVMTPNSLEMRCLIYRCLAQAQDPELVDYLKAGPKRILELTETLSALFAQYGQFGREVFERLEGWQGKILKELFVQGPWKLPVQWLQKAEPVAAKMHCFGIDTLSEDYWNWLLRSPSLSIYQFSPCLHYWGDVCSQRERRQKLRYWRRQAISEASQEQLESYLSQGPSLLGSLGQVGRQTMRILDRWELEVEECYEERETRSLLGHLQDQLLQFQTEAPSVHDASLQIVRTGTSLEQEVRWLYGELAHLVAENGFRWEEISVMAPNIELYAPWVALFFKEIPYRIYGVEEGGKTPFARALKQMLDVAEKGRFSSSEMLALFEASAFARKQGWGAEELERIRSWLDEGRIDWGLDQKHRKEVLDSWMGHVEVGEKGSWEAGLDRLLDRIVFYREGVQVQPDLLEEVLVVFQGLKRDLMQLASDASLAVWADRWEKLAGEYLYLDVEQDGAGFQQMVTMLRQAHLRIGETPLPFSLLKTFFASRSKGECNGSELNAVRFANLEEASLIPAKALFILGMDEESFPVRDTLSSLNLLSRQARAEVGRYHFLQALFSATEFLRISYRHSSVKEGKLVGPSLVVEELLAFLKKPEVVHTVEWPIHSNGRRNFGAEAPKPVAAPQGEVVVPLRDLSLLARHPWKFFLQKKEGLFLLDEREDSFAFLKARCLRASLQKSLDQVWEEEALPEGVIGEALRQEIEEERQGWQEILQEHQAQQLFRLDLKDFVIDIDGCSVRLVGEIGAVSSQGLVVASDGHISGTLKAWPEILAVALAQNTPRFLCLKTGKLKEIENPQEALQNFLRYYFMALHQPVPLLPDWADGLLRKGVEELDRKMKTSRFEDPVLDWIKARYEIPSAAVLFSQWANPLRQTFSELIRLYPTRTSKQETHASL